MESSNSLKPYQAKMHIANFFLDVSFGKWTNNREINGMKVYPASTREILCNNQLSLWHHGESTNKLLTHSDQLLFLELSILIRNFSFSMRFHCHFIFQKISKRKRRRKRIKITLFSNRLSQ